MEIIIGMAIGLSIFLVGFGVGLFTGAAMYMDENEFSDET
jgi:hypothetical protein